MKKLKPRFAYIFQRGFLREFLALGIAVCLGVAGTGCGQQHSSVPAAGQEGPTTAADARPNVLLITVDDLRPLLGTYGHEEMQTPVLDGLAESGTLFERAYTYVATCSPSRATMLTGLRPDSLGFYNNVIPLREAQPNVVTLPQHFKRNGYRSLKVGFKIFHHGDPQSWTKDVEVNIEGREGPGRYYDEASIEAMRKEGGGWRHGPAYEHPDVPDTAYVDGEVASRTVEQLRRESQREEPFFMALGFLRPHLPFNCPDRYWNRYDEGELPANYVSPKNINRFSLTNYGELRQYSNIPRQGPVPKRIGRAMNRAYRACVTYVDTQIGRVLRELRAQGLAGNTIVVLWGDHGFKLGEHKSWSKHTNYEIDTRIPLIVRVPGGAAGQRTDALVESVDLYATLAELAGLPPPPQQQGLSFVPLLEDPERQWKKAAFTQFGRYGRNGPPDVKVMGRAIRTDRFRYVEWRREDGRAGEEVLARELYDHRTDPEENVNVAGEAGYAEEVERLSRELQAGWRAALPDGVEPPG